ncbi:MAG TPA: AAA family ATPase, partial [Arenibaculum sp.]|nr:AAA family ATPase [Arenibaculum sp.]
ATLVIETGQGRNDYAFRLFHAAGDTLIFDEEACRFSRKGKPLNPKWIEFGAGHREALLLDKTADAVRKTRVTIAGLLRGFVVYHFHDTSKEARVKMRWPLTDNVYLIYDAANLGPFLLRLRDGHPKHYRRIVETIRQVAPFFDDFVLEPEHGTMLLRWREQGSDIVFGADQASDGTLRAIALIATLQQPTDTLPALLIIDEPELGLHPYAITVIGGLIKAMAQDRQVLIATQSPMLLDQFDAADVVVAERRGRSTTYRRLDEDRLRDWLEDYTLSDLWARNVLGGRPREGQP